MNVLIYESSSTGGNFKYSSSLFREFQKHRLVGRVDWMIPSCSDALPSDHAIKKLLCDRNKVKVRILTRVNFLLRHLINPFILLLFLVKKKDSYFVLLNDFEQASAPLWVPAFKILLRKHRFAVFLHDPDRDAYPPSKGFSAFCMRLMMSLMDVGICHEVLPDKPYYRPNGKTQYVQVPHGYYPQVPADEVFLKALSKEIGNYACLVIMGNIRPEKNYELAIHALTKIRSVKLVIAGSPANSQVDPDELKELAKSLNVGDRIVWRIWYLTDAEMAAVVEVADIVLLNYKPSFASQSGVLNMVAPYKKKVIISDTRSSLTRVAERFNLAALVNPDDLTDYVEKIEITLARDINETGWNEYQQWASWENNVNITLEVLKKVSR
jgi:glycosyltransferase involved in cell wall biosynthesis